MGLLTDPIVKAMDDISVEIQSSITSLTHSLNELGNSMNKVSESSNSLQEKLVFWTKIMAGAIIVQIVAIILTAFF